MKWSAGVGAVALTALISWLFVDDPCQPSPAPTMQVGLAHDDHSNMFVFGGRF